MILTQNLFCYNDDKRDVFNKQTRNFEMYALEGIFYAQYLEITKAETYFVYVDFNDVSVDVYDCIISKYVVNLIRYLI